MQVLVISRPGRPTLTPALLRKLEPRHCKFDAGVFYRDRSNIGLTIMGPVQNTNFGQARFLRPNLRREFSRPIQAAQASLVV